MLAIVIPYYNFQFLEKTMDSLASQTDNRFTVYIGDDHSPEKPLEMLTKYKLNIVYKRFDSHMGGVSLCKHWERCMSLLNNEDWFMILGDDDILGKEVVSSFYKYISEVDDCKINVIKYASQLINGMNEPISDIYTADKIQNSVELYVKKIKNQHRSSLSEHIFRRSKYAELGFYDSPVAWHSDDMMILQYSHFDNIFCINEAVVRIRISEISISGSINQFTGEKASASNAFHLDLLTTWIKKFNPEQIELLLHVLCISAIRHYAPSTLNKIFHIGYNLNGFFWMSKMFINLTFSKFRHIPSQIKFRNLDFYIDVYFRLDHSALLKTEFENRSEFCTHVFDADPDDVFYRTVLTKATENNDDIVIICTNKFHFTDAYSVDSFFESIMLAKYLNADAIFADGYDTDWRFYVRNNLYWVNEVRSFSLVVLFKQGVEKLNRLINFENIDIASVLTEVLSNKFVLYPYLTCKNSSFKLVNSLNNEQYK